MVVFISQTSLASQHPGGRGRKICMSEASLDNLMRPCFRKEKTEEKELMERCKGGAECRRNSVRGAIAMCGC